MTKILFITAYPIEDASCRYRVHQFVPYLERAGYECTVSAFCSPELFTALKFSGRSRTKIAETLRCAAHRLSRLVDIPQFDFVVIHREAFPFFAPRVENWVLRRHRKVIFSFDDAIYAGHSEVAHLNHPRLYRWKHGRRYDEVIRRSYHVIAGNRILAEYARRFNSSVSVIPTVVDCRQYPVRGQLPGPEGSRPIAIGWVGSRSTAPYLTLVESALRRLAHAYPGGVCFRFIGHPAYAPNIPYSSSVPFELETEIEDLQSIDIGLMPLPDTEWTRGKCAFKAIQYMASGIPVVASPVGITPDLIQHGVNGLLASSADDWFRELERLICDRELRERIALTGRKTVEQSYSLEKWAPRLVSLFDQLKDGERARQTESIAA
jgi:glycosyltransferase involved in cell wall biosynthesis